MRTPEYVWLIVEGEKVVGAEMPNGDPSIYSVPIGLYLKEALEQMGRDKWQTLADEQIDMSGNYRIRLVRDNPPQ